MQQQQPVGKIKAFSILELMTVMIILSLLLVAGVPAYENIMRNNAALITAGKIAASLRLAKAEAIGQGVPVTVCPISSSFNPTALFNEATEQWPCQATTSWSAWKVFKDPNFNATENFSDGWPIIQYVSNTIAGTVTANVSGPITFDTFGFANIHPSTTRTGWTWSASYGSGEWSWSYNYSSAYGGTYYRVFSIVPTGCTGQNAKAVEVTQNGVVSIYDIDC